LEQLRKRQRDEALQAQEELLEGVANSAIKGKGPVGIEPTAEQESVLAEEREPYNRSMSPDVIDITKLTYEERQIDIVLEVEDRRALVSFHRAHTSYPCVEGSASSSNVAQYQVLDSSRRPCV